MKKRIAKKVILRFLIGKHVKNTTMNRAMASRYGRLLLQELGIPWNISTKLPATPTPITLVYTEDLQKTHSQDWVSGR